MSDSVERFSSRVVDYAKYRPGYPPEVIELLKTECGLSSGSVIADLGSGTGKLTELFLKNGNEVFGVEPNAAMRTLATELLQGYEKFQNVDGAAEATTLPSSSVDFVTAAQAFHWFKPIPVRLEVQRILRPRGWAVLIWNERKLQSTAFLKEYEDLLLKYGTDYKEVRHDRTQDSIVEFFDPEPAALRVFSNTQEFDFEGLMGRVRSSSYTPEEGHPAFQPMMSELKQVFAKHNRNGIVSFDYDTKVYYARFAHRG